MPYLIMRKPPNELNVYPFSNGITIGKRPENDIVLENSKVSRLHAEIQRHCNGDYLLRDKGSTNGTLVNGEKKSEVCLSHSSVFQIVDYRFTFVDCADDHFAVQDVVCEENEPEYRTVVLGKKSDTHLSPFPYKSEKQLSEFLAGIGKIASELDDEPLRMKILDLLTEVTSASRAVILLKNNDESLRKWAKKGFEADNDAMKISQSTIRKVLSEGRPAIIHEGIRSEIPKSIVKFDLKSVICVPLAVRNHVIGCLYLDKPVNASIFNGDDLRLVEILAHQIGASVENARLHKKLKEETITLKKRLKSKGNIVGKSEKMHELYRMIQKIAPFDDISVLILGESGTGKELVAGRLHELSKRSGPFVAVNCAAISEQLFESEMFGHVKKAFNDASDRVGLFEEANGGTIFLDEIAEVKPELQKKLLRVLQERKLRRVGSNKEIRVDVRVIAATNRDITDDTVRKKIGFRDDLFYRLQQMVLTIPSLRERNDDIPMLTEYFLKKFSESHGYPKPDISDTAMTFLKNYNWPGNVRELKSVIETALILGDGRMLRPEDLPETIVKSDRLVLRKKFPTLEELEKQHIQKALELTGGKKMAEVAKFLGIGRDTLRRKRKKYGL